jgi:hypothetical protein
MMAQYSPAYQFQLQQGLQAANRAAAAGGVGGSGGTLKALDQYAQNYAGTGFASAANLYNQNYNRLASLAGLGAGAATTAGQAGIGTSEYAGNLGYGAAQYAGNMNMQAGELAAQNTLGAAGYQANAAINAAQAKAGGVMGQANALNNMLGGIGQSANMIGMAGFGGPNSANPGSWSFGNIPGNLGGMWGGAYGSGAGTYSEPGMGAGMTSDWGSQFQMPGGQPYSQWSSVYGNPSYYGPPAMTGGGAGTVPSVPTTSGFNPNYEYQYPAPANW